MIAALAIMTPIAARSESPEQFRESERQALQDQLQRVTQDLIVARDTERARVARDLHDDVSQQLAALSMSLNSLKRQADGLADGRQLATDIAALEQRTFTLTEDVRRISYDLHPVVLQHAGLMGALTRLCGELGREHKLAVSCSAVGDVGSIDAYVALCLYRIAQEALRNTVTHAAAQCADVQLRLVGSDVALTIADDGKGFDLVNARQSRGLGLVSIEERANLLGGTSEIQTASGNGTKVSVSVPVRRP
jgi:two-component system sensor histidine kinase UhpB